MIPMMQPQSVGETPTIKLQDEAESKTDGVFASMLETTLTNANESIQAATLEAEAFAAGGHDDIHGTMLALAQADIQLRTVGSMRNKIVEAFHELWRMQV
jgi:flagellar hook-basal body complex protein FliE